jgi:hypothetical protein
MATHFSPLRGSRTLEGEGLTCANRARRCISKVFACLYGRLNVNPIVQLPRGASAFSDIFFGLSDK